MEPVYLNTKKKIKVQKKKTWNVANCIHYDLAIFQYEIPCCVGSANKTNWLNFGRKK
jgi:hypothetical protein